VEIKITNTGFVFPRTSFLNINFLDLGSKFLEYLLSTRVLYSHLKHTVKGVFIFSETKNRFSQSRLGEPLYF
jgi:hypothetical protein